MHDNRAFDARAHLLAAGSDDVPAGSTELALASWLAVIAERLDEAAALAERAVQQLPRLPPTASAGHLASAGHMASAGQLASAGHLASAEDLAIRGLLMMVALLRGEGEVDHDVLDGLRSRVDELDRLEPMLEIANWYTFVDRFDDAGRIVASRTHQARRAGDTVALMWSLGCGAELDLRRGRWRQGRRDLVEALMMSEREDARAGYLHVLLARLAAYQGDSLAARHHLTLARRDAYDLGDRSTIWRADAVEGLVALAEGDAENAVAVLGHLERQGVAAGPALAAVRLWDGDLVEALMAMGDIESARRVTAGLASSPSTTWTVATQQRCAALVSGDSEAGLEAAMASAEGFGAIGAPFEQARSELLAGTIATQTHRAPVARSLLQRAQRTFDALGAANWATATARQLADLVGALTRAATRDPLVVLSSQERDLAVLVARGVSNRAAAETMHISVKTVEAHLTRMYRKLGIATRTQLAAMVVRWSRTDDWPQARE